jgi:hypothetical protein
MYRAHALHLIGVAFVVYLAAAILDGLLSLGHGFFVSILGLLITLVAGFLVQAALVKAVQDVRDGRVDLSIGETLSAALPAILPVAGAAILAGIAIAIGFVFVIVPGLILLTMWAVIVPAIVVEGSSTLGAFGRSRELVRGRGWHVFGTLVVTWLILIVVDFLIGLLLAALPLSITNFVSTVVAGSLVGPFVALVVTLMYYRLVGTPVGGGGGNPNGYDPNAAGPAGPGGYGQQGDYPQQGGQYPPPGGGYGSQS